MKLPTHIGIYDRSFKGYGTWFASVCLSVCSHVLFNSVQQSGKIVILTGSGIHGLDYKNGDIRKSTAFKSYGVKTK